MSSDPFARLTRLPRWRARLQRWRDSLLRPIRPARIRPDRAGPANLLLVGVDTLRADHLGLAGYRQPTSPNLDRLADAGTVFLRTTAPAPWTLPSFAGALTGLMPGLHGGFLDGDPRNMDTQPPRRLRPEVVTLARHLHGQGYRTAAFYSNQFFAFGLAESFDEHHYHNLPAEDLAAVAANWIRRNADRPFFCFLLVNDPHEPTTPAAQDLAPFLPDLAARGLPVDDASLLDLVRWGEPPGIHLGKCENAAAEEVERALAVKLAIYDATIRQVDRTIGLLQDRLRRWRLAERTLTTVFSDHGEEFLDHVQAGRSWRHDPRNIYGIGHGHTLFEELLHVPWISWGPGVPTARRDEPVSLLDLTPTLLDWLELPPLAQTAAPAAPGLPDELASALQGRSVAAEPGTEPEDRLLLSEAIAFGPDLVSLRRGRWKLIARRDGHPLALFDLTADPGETRDRQLSEPRVMTDFQAFLQSWRDSGLGAGDNPDGGDKPGDWNDMDAEIRQRLKDLGYSE